jgi:hypothetical protein
VQGQPSLAFRWPQVGIRAASWGFKATTYPFQVVRGVTSLKHGAPLDTLTAGGFGSSREEIASGDVTLFDVAGAFRSGEAMRALTARAGRSPSPVSSTAARGCPPRSSSSPASSCPAAPPGRFGQDDWVRVAGALFPLGDEVIVDASDVSSVARPEHPYLGT